jgi:Na+-transporting methylmalonyl-CoA/oxaloacetate decarboxylase gamma subunit
MYGLAAIQQANGWAMAGAGAAIVLIGLTVLSFLISLIPRLTGLFEEKTPIENASETKKTKTETVVPEKLPENIEAAARIYMTFNKDLDQTFSLIDLHRKSREIGLPHPHLSINRFRDAGILLSNGEGLFSWKTISE